MISDAVWDTQPADWCVLRVALNGAIPWCWFIPKWHCICTSAPWCKGHQKVRVQGAAVTKWNCHCGVCCFMLARVQICALWEDCTAQLMKWAVERWTPIDLLHCNPQQCASPLGLPNMQDAPVLNHHNVLHRTGSLQVGAAQWREFVAPFGNSLVTYAQKEEMSKSSDSLAMPSCYPISLSVLFITLPTATTVAVGEIPTAKACGSSNSVHCPTIRFHFPKWLTDPYGATNMWVQPGGVPVCR